MQNLKCKLLFWKLTKNRNDHVNVIIDFFIQNFYIPPLAQLKSRKGFTQDDGKDEMKFISNISSAMLFVNLNHLPKTEIPYLEIGTLSQMKISIGHNYMPSFEKFDEYYHLRKNSTKYELKENEGYVYISIIGKGKWYAYLRFKNGKTKTVKDETQKIDIDLNAAQRPLENNHQSNE